MRMTGGKAIVAALRPHGVDVVYGLVGGKLGPVFKAISGASWLRYVGVRHEAAAGYMAAAHYARHGQLALVLTELGPGTTNVVGSIASAFNNRLPLLLVTSNNQQAASYPQRGMFMEADLVAMLRPVTKFNAAIHDIRRIPELVRRAFHEALSGQPGPVHLDVPQDILNQEHDFADPTPVPDDTIGRVNTPVAGADGVAAAAALLEQAERPLIICGGGLAQSGDWDGMRMLADRLDAAAVATQRGIGAIDTSSDRYIGHGGVIGGDAVNRALREADVVLALGCRFSSWLWDADGPIVRPPQRLIQVDSDPSALGAAVPVVIGLLGDAGRTARAIAERITDGTAGIHGAARRAWCVSLRQSFNEYRARLTALTNGPQEIMHPARLAAEIAACLPADALIMLDGGHTSFWMNDVVSVRQPRQAFHEPGLAQLGFGLPYAIAMQLAEPDRVVVNVTGDGAFGFTAMELDTARRYSAKVITLIHNNAAWGIIQAGQQRQQFSIGTDLTGTDYAAMATGLGCHGEQVRTVAEIVPAFRRAIKSGLPAVIDCITCFEPHPMLTAFGATNMLGMPPP